MHTKQKSHRLVRIKALHTTIQLNKMAQLRTLLARSLQVNHTIILATEEVICPKTNKATSLILDVRPYKEHACRCPHCGAKCPVYDKGNGIRRLWRHLDLGPCKLYLRYAAPRVMCPVHKVVTAAVPWADHDCWFTRDFDETVAWLAKQMSKSALAKYLRIDWETVGRCISRVKKRLDTNPAARFENLVSIAVDETAIAKGHRYITVVINNLTGKIIWIGEKHGKEVFMKFLSEVLTQEQREGIRFLSGDGARWIDICMQEMLPNCIRCVDAFHVVQWGNDALDVERRTIWRELNSDAKSQRKAPESQDKGSKEFKKAKLAEDLAKQVKGAQYALGKAPENLTANQEARLEFIRDTSPRLYRAYCLKEGLRYILKLDNVRQAEVELKQWYWRASHSRLNSMKELAKKIKRHWTNILNTIEHGLSSAKCEAVNNSIKLVLRRAYGFRSLKNMTDMIMLCCSDLEVQLPGRS